MGDLDRFIATQNGYRRVFAEVSGSGPWPCHFCGETVDGTLPAKTPRSLCVHHIDGDHSNNVPDNLDAAHWDCHSRHHTQRRWDDLDPQQRREFLAPAYAVAHSPEVRARAGRATRAYWAAEKRKAPGRRAGAEAAAKLKYRCDECGYESSPGVVGIHQKRHAHSGRTRLSP